MAGSIGNTPAKSKLCSSGGAAYSTGAPALKRPFRTTGHGHDAQPETHSRMRRSALALGRCLWQKSAAFATCCGSSVVEHSLGKGEVESSILSRSTINPLKLLAY